MDKSAFESWAENVARKNGFVIDQLIYTGTYYALERVRNVIFSGSYHGEPAVLKVYDDPRPSDEPLALQRFNDQNQSRVLIAPKLYAYEMVNPKKGWLIMEKLPDGGSFFQSPLGQQERQDFIQMFLEYRDNFPHVPGRALSLIERLPADEFHAYRVSGWLRLANDMEAELVLRNEKTLLEHAGFITKYMQALDKIRQGFRGRKMVWCHGHAKPQEFYRTDKVTYLTDFAHARLYPEGYEVAFVIWADQLMAGNWRLNYQEWRLGIDAWIADFRSFAEKLNLTGYDHLIKVCLLERVLGTILADVVASDRDAVEKVERLRLLNRLLDDLL